eukprot:CAMPEP_0119546344 /NCGR_PEP_ID=MMETSP1352-20130426/808_1 /TAXON_ID=265584 /ORGANISM="Stauroneis constricta, Strain CCMP1120" /LENGTH=298 /DNA_ID=CAMNT_0007591039 /DNA_START=165 /DNA_END=1061 /DNA_ORIENTATION=+
MPTDGSNWKDLLKATREDNAALVKTHLGDGVDVNFQHPEYLTCPIFEAIRGGHLHLVRLLVEEGNASISTAEELTDCVPLEVAVQEKQHGIVDYLLQRLSELGTPDDGKIVKKVLIDQGASSSSDEVLLRYFIGLGHEIVVVVSGQKTHERVKMLIDDIQEESNNTKVTILDRNDAIGMTEQTRNVHYWIMRDPSSSSSIERSGMVSMRKDMTSLQRAIVLTEAARTKDASQIIQGMPNTVCMIDPTSDSLSSRAYDAIVSPFVQYPRSSWPSTAWHLLTTWDDVEGKVYDYRRVQQV